MNSYVVGFAGPAQTAPQLKHLRPVVAEANADPGFLEMAGEFGGVHTLPKPFKPADLPATVSSCLAAPKQPSLPPGSDRNAASGT